MSAVRKRQTKNHNNHMELTGKIIAALGVREGVSKSTGNPWKVQEFVIETHDQYPKRMCFEVFGADKLQQYNIQVGEEMTVSFDIDARQYNDRWYNSIRVWNINRNVGQSAQPAQPSTPFAPAQPFSPQETTTSDSTDDLPF